MGEQKIADMFAWLERNRASLLRAQLIMLRAWILADAPQDGSQVMGGFTPWVQAMGGYLGFLGIEGFRTNQDQLLAHDQGSDELAALFRAWRDVFGSRPLLAHDVWEMGTMGAVTSENAVPIQADIRAIAAEAAGEGSTDDKAAAAIARLRAAYPVAERTDRPLAPTGLGRHLKKGRGPMGRRVHAALQPRSAEEHYLRSTGPGRGAGQAGGK